MVLSSSDKAVIEACFIEKGWKGARIVREFPGKNWHKASVNRLIKKIQIINELKAKITECWEAIPQTKIQDIIGAWKSRLRDVNRAAGGPIEHLRT